MIISSRNTLTVTSKCLTKCLGTLRPSQFDIKLAITTYNQIQFIIVFENFPRIELTLLKENLYKQSLPLKLDICLNCREENLLLHVCVPSWLKMLYFILLQFEKNIFWKWVSGKSETTLKMNSLKE